MPKPQPEVEESVVVLGRISGPYGVKGWVHIHPFGDDPQSWSRMACWRLSQDARAIAQEWQVRYPERLKPHGDGWVAKLMGVEDRNAAEGLSGCFFGGLRSELPATAEDEFYWADLIGLSVRNTHGEVLGEVSGLLETGANDVLKIRGADGEQRLLPFVAQVVLAVDRTAGTMEVDWERDW